MEMAKGFGSRDISNQANVATTNQTDNEWSHAILNLSYMLFATLTAAWFLDQNIVREAWIIVDGLLHDSNVTSHITHITSGCVRLWRQAAYRNGPLVARLVQIVFGEPRGSKRPPAHRLLPEYTPRPWTLTSRFLLLFAATPMLRFHRSQNIGGPVPGLADVIGG